jgi:hypothetical protein
MTAKIQAQIAKYKILVAAGCRRYIIQLLDAEKLLEEAMTQQTQQTQQAHTHTILCDLEKEWIAKIAIHFNVAVEGNRLLCTEEQYDKIKKLSPTKFKNLGKKIGYDYECHILECFVFEGKILTQEEKEIKEKIRVVGNMNADDLKEHIKSFKFKNVTLMKEGGDVVEIYLQSNTDIDAIMQRLWDEYIPFQMSESGNRIQCAGKKGRIKDAYERLRAENAARPWFKPIKE